MLSTLCLIINHRGKKIAVPQHQRAEWYRLLLPASSAIADLRRALRASGALWVRFFGLIYRCENFCYDVTYVRPYRLTSCTSAGTVTSRTSARTDCRGGGGEAGHSLGTGVFG